MIVYAQQNDTLDAIVYRQFGSTNGLVEQALELNPKLNVNAILPIGTKVELPEIQELEHHVSNSSIQLWD